MNLATITYNNNIIKTLTDTDTSVILATKDKYVEQNITASIIVPEYDGELQSKCLCFTADAAGSTIAMSVEGTPTLEQNFQTSVDGVAWSAFTPGNSTITLSNVGDKVYFKGDNSNGISESSSICYTFVMTGSIAASGNIMSLIDNGACTCTVIPNDYCFMALFDQCTSLITAPELPATSLNSYCYSFMFNGCTALCQTPSLPAITLSNSCYAYMFQNCSSLKTPSIMSSQILAEMCCKGMYVGCTELTGRYTLPGIQMATECYRDIFALAGDIEVVLPSKQLNNSCYKGMFYNNTKLTHVPQLPATILASGCYAQMFSGCTSLYVSDAPTAEAAQSWRIPNSDTFVNTYSQNDMFKDCLGVRTSDKFPGITGQSYTYYTQNQPG